MATGYCLAVPFSWVEVASCSRVPCASRPEAVRVWLGASAQAWFLALESALPPPLGLPWAGPRSVSRPVPAWPPVALAQQVGLRALQAPGQTLRPVPASPLVELVFSLAQQISRQALRVQEQASPPVLASLLAELRFWEARQVFQQAWRGQERSRVPPELGSDSLAGSPEPAALPEQHEPELPQR